MSSEKKNILFASSWYPNDDHPYLGNFVRRQAQLLATEHAVTVINTVPSPSLKEIRTEKTNEGSLQEIIVHHPQGTSLISKRKHQKKALKAGIKQLEMEPDVLLTQILLPKGWQFEILKDKFQIPWIHLEQGSYFRSSERKKWNVVQRVILKKCEKAIDRLLASSEFVKKDIQEVFPNMNIGILPNHVNTEIFKPDIDHTANEVTRFLHVSTLDPKTKNPRGIIDACKFICETTDYKFELTIISDGDTGPIEEYINQLELEKIIQVIGAKKWEELPKYYRSSDAFILNSIYETFSIVLAESWACGLPVITTPVGIGYELPQELGYNTIIDDPESLAEAMIKIIQKEYSFDVNAIRKKGELFSAESVLKILNKEINDVCA